MKINQMFWIVLIFISIVLVIFITAPIAKIMVSSSPPSLIKALTDTDVVRSILLSIITSGSAALISLAVGIPFSYLLSRFNFSGKKFIESIINIPIVIPHPVIGIAILSIAGKNCWFGRFLQMLGVKIMGTVGGIVTVLTFVSIPFFINAAKEGFENVSQKLEKVSRSLGASLPYTFFHITLPLAKRSIFIGFVMSFARAISEFGAVVIVAYHPMIAPVLIYERFEAYGLEYSLPVAFWLVSISLAVFIILRILIMKSKNE